jgi:threonine aldolase
VSVVDLRSDTVTKPSAEMRQAMANAEVGDDVFGGDPTVNELQAHVAAMFGHEAALFTPSGSMANQIAMQLSVPAASELICDADAHVVTYEMGAAAAYGGISTRTWPAVGGAIDVEHVRSMVREEAPFTVATKAIAVEQTHNRAGGTVIPMETLRGLRGVADSFGIALHCDGARIWHAHVADGVPLRSYGELFDTMSVCLSKGLGAPVGSLVLGPAEKIEQARIIRKRMGGGMRQIGLLAAAGRYALDNNIARLADDHARARRIADALEPFGVIDPARVRTNLVIFDLSGFSFDAATFAAATAAEGVLTSTMGTRLGRVVTHLDVDDDGVDRAIEVMTAILKRG